MSTQGLHLNKNMMDPNLKMLHTKIQGNRPLVLENEIFKWFLPYIGMADILGHVTWTISTNLLFPIPQGLYLKFDFNWP